MRMSDSDPQRQAPRGSYIYEIIRDERMAMMHMPKQNLLEESGQNVTIYLDKKAAASLTEWKARGGTVASWFADLRQKAERQDGGAVPELESRLKKLRTEVEFEKNLLRTTREKTAHENHKRFVAQEEIRDLQAQFAQLQQQMDIDSILAEVADTLDLYLRAGVEWDNDIVETAMQPIIQACRDIVRVAQITRNQARRAGLLQGDDEDATEVETEQDERVAPKPITKKPTKRLGTHFRDLDEDED